MAADTLARIFWERVERSADRPAHQFKQGTAWKTTTWREVGETVREVALGLLALGRGKGDAVALLSGSRAEWVQADFSIFSAGCVTVPVYPSYPPDLATIVYTSGTTGPPKGVMQTHGNHVAAVSASKQATPVEEGWVHLLFLPLAHSFARLESFLGVAHGLTTAFAENLDKVGENLREVRPHFICSVPRVFEKVYAKILSGVEAGSPVKRKIFGWAVSVGRDVSRHQQRGQPVPATLELKRKLAHRLVFSKLHAALGGRLPWAVSRGAPPSPGLAEVFHAARLLLLEGHGLTPTCPALTFNRPDRFKFGSVGQALPGLQLRI